MPQTCSPFASRSIGHHLLRGFGGVLAFVASALLLTNGGPLGMIGAALAVMIALILLRGCPMCWLIGLFETIALRARR